MRHIVTPAFLVSLILGAYALAAYFDERAEREMLNRQDTASWREQQRAHEARRRFCRKHQNICAPAEYLPVR